MAVADPHCPKPLDSGELLIAAEDSASATVYSARRHFDTERMKGKPGLDVLQALIDGLRPYLPAGVRTVRARLTWTHGFQLWAVPSDLPGGADYDFMEVRITDGGGSLQSRGPEAPLGLGTFLPVFGVARTRLAVVDALRLIQEAVQRIAGPWPEENAIPDARSDGDDVLAWFQSETGDRLLPEIRITLPVPVDEH
jgi:hypothetical protein